MPSHLFADRPAPQPPRRDSVDELISQTRRLRGDVDAVRRDAVVDEDDPQGRWQRALCDLAVHQLDDLGAHLGQLREGLPPLPGPDGPPGREDQAGFEDLPPRPDSLLSRVGSAEWNLLTDEVSWSEELHRIFGRPAAGDPMTLDELPSMVFAEDQALLTEMVTDCLVDGKPIDGEFRIVRADGRVRTLHMTGEPVLDADGCTASMWAVLRDVSELRRSQRAVRESQDTLTRRQHIDRTERRVATQMHEAVLPPWRGERSIPANGPAALDLAGHHLPSPRGALNGSQWFDAQEIPGGLALLSVGDLTGQGVTATSAMAMLMGAQRALAVAGIRPGPLMGHLNALLDSAAQPALGSTVCCHYDPSTRILSWAQAGHPAPLLYRGGVGRALPRPGGVLLGATAGGVYEQGETALLPGDVLVLHTDGLTRGTGAPHDSTGHDRLLALAPRLTVARSAQDCVRLIVEEFDVGDRQHDASVMVARIA
ncbi:PAS domain S-box protein [Streptomyces spongiicola]|uniref:PAS domain S-box protein n=1 Tax=Streptomyces spongiicola TaxID=1690221 RepID=A0A2S1Z859_9ACTN|nr:SpoIIE family protein phosphatase [Streptomyces spongiicola]AWK12502.1 phosphatase [Streptomyces spongiicola]GBP99566.1 PAS domain S-box protein [Streptomyces spongiicola]